MTPVSFKPEHARLAQPGLVPALLLLALSSCATARPPAPASGPVEEATLMESLRQEAKPSPAAALADADQAEALFGESPFAEERRALAIQALVDLGRIGDARSRAYQFLGRYPNGPFTARVQSLTGVHPTPSVGPPP